MVKHTQNIRRLLPTNCLSMFDHFKGLALKGLSLEEWILGISEGSKMQFMLNKSADSPKAYLVPCQTSKMEGLPKIVNTPLQSIGKTTSKFLSFTFR